MHGNGNFLRALFRDAPSRLPPTPSHPPPMRSMRAPTANAKTHHHLPHTRGGAHLTLPPLRNPERVVGRRRVDALVDVALALRVSHEDDAERPPAADVHAVAEEEVVHHPPDPEVQPPALQRCVGAGMRGGWGVKGEG